MSRLTKAKTKQAKDETLVTIGHVGIDNTLAGLALSAKAHIKPLGDTYGDGTRRRWTNVMKALQAARLAYTTDEAREAKKKLPTKRRRK